MTRKAPWFWRMPKAAPVLADVHQAHRPALGEGLARVDVGAHQVLGELVEGDDRRRQREEQQVAPPQAQDAAAGGLGLWELHTCPMIAGRSRAVQGDSWMSSSPLASATILPYISETSGSSEAMDAMRASWRPGTSCAHQPVHLDHAQRVLPGVEAGHLAHEGPPRVYASPGAGSPGI